VDIYYSIDLYRRFGVHKMLGASLCESNPLTTLHGSMR
jgi:hypothetical protein